MSLSSISREKDLARVKKYRHSRDRRLTSMNLETIDIRGKYSYEAKAKKARGSNNFSKSNYIYLLNRSTAKEMGLRRSKETRIPELKLGY